jgi:hypothetical protein
LLPTLNPKHTVVEPSRKGPIDVSTIGKRDTTNELDACETLTALFTAMDSDKNGWITWQEQSKYIEKVKEGKIANVTPKDTHIVALNKARRGELGFPIDDLQVNYQRWVYGFAPFYLKEVNAENNKVNESKTPITVAPIIEEKKGPMLPLTV